MAESKACNIECIKGWARAFQFIGAALLGLLVIIRFISGAFISPPTFILTVYYAIFACLLVIAEFQFKIFMQYFHFLYYSWGKAVLDFFIFTITFDTDINPWFQIPVACFFAVAAAMYLIIAFACKRKPKAAEANKPGEPAAVVQPAAAEADKEANRQ